MSRPRAKRAISKSPGTTPRTRAKSAKASNKMNPGLAQLVRKHWPAKGRAERIARAQRAWDTARKIGATFTLDTETIKKIAEDPDLEYP